MNLWQIDLNQFQSELINKKLMIFYQLIDLSLVLVNLPKVNNRSNKMFEEYVNNYVTPETYRS